MLLKMAATCGKEVFKSPPLGKSVAVIGWGRRAYCRYYWLTGHRDSRVATLAGGMLGWLFLLSLPKEALERI
jgi:hypothetical protein